ncbi:MAG TPA: efflux RND transporter periplasmic adaptor subunit [Gammaproteobacteria bacterium]
MSSLNPLPRAAFLLLALGAVVLTGCSGEQAAGPGQQGMPPPEVTVVTLKPETVTLSRELPGRVNASLVAEVRPQVSGVIRERLFEEGGLVAEGEPLYQLEDDIYRAELQSAEAALARARAGVEVARARAARADELVKTKAISQQDYDDIRAGLLQAQAELKVAQAAVTSARVYRDYSRITSPISGRIGKSAVTRGALVTTNQAQPLATVQQLDPLFVDLNQPSSEMLELRKAIAAGTTQAVDSIPVTLLLEDGSRYEHEGRLAFSEMTVDPSTGSFSLRVVVPNPDNLLLPGMYVRAQVAVGVREQALLVPQQAVVRDAKGNSSVMLVGAEDKVEPRPVTLSRTIGDKWLVEEGLKEGERVITEGLQKIRPGAPVRVAAAADQTAAE